MAHGKRFAAVLGTISALACIGMAPLRALAGELLEGQVVLAFEPQLTGDPAQDFARPVGSGETFSVYLIAGPLPVPTQGFSFSLGFSEATNITVGEVRSFGDVFASQNSIGTVVSVSVSVQAGCLDRNAEAVLAEIDLTRVGIEVPLHIQLVGSPYGSPKPPEYLNCRGDGMPFDDSLAQQLAVQVPAPVPVSQPTWATVKSLYRSP